MSAVDRDFGLTAIAYAGAFNGIVYEWALRGADLPIDAVLAELTGGCGRCCPILSDRACAESRHR